MAPIAENDEFWRKLYNIWLKTSEKNYEEIKLGLFRTDYMLERDENGIETPFLVEFNTIASGAGALCCGVTDMHHALNIKPFNVTNSKLSFELKTDEKVRNLYFFVVLDENSCKQYKNNALDNVLAFGLVDGVKQEKLNLSQSVLIRQRTC